MSLRADPVLAVKSMTAPTDPVSLDQGCVDPGREERNLEKRSVPGLTRYTRIASHPAARILARVSAACLVWAVAVVPGVARGATSLFDGKSLEGWHSQGAADWRVENGEIIGELTRANAHGWLVLDRPYQEYALQLWFRCTPGCDPGLLVGMHESAGRTTGTHVSLAAGNVGVEAVTLNRRGDVVETAPLPERTVTPAFPSTGLPPARKFDAPGGHPLLALPATPQINGDGWNHLELRVVHQEFQVFVNGIMLNLGDRQPENATYGPLALHLSGEAGAVIRVRDIGLSDFTAISLEDEEDGRNFRKVHVTPLFFGQGEGVADLNRDGYPDLVAATIYLLGPDFTSGGAFERTKPGDPTGYRVGQTLGHLVADFTGDGWPDILMTTWPAGSPGILYVNPRGENRYWSRHTVLPAMDGEFYSLADLDGDGDPPEVIFAVDGAISIARPDPRNPTAQWNVVPITEEGPWGQRNAHGLGVGDINGDGRTDVISAWGWWEQPAEADGHAWPFHPVAFGGGNPRNPGGGQMYAYDVNGDGFADVITSMIGHGRGLAWFEQKRDADGNIDFVRHTIMDLDPADSHGVTFSELHTLALADIDGDGLKDIVTGKSATNIWHYNPFGYTDADGEPVLYWFKLQRQPNGDVEFIPKLISRKSGIGRQVQVEDLNGDGRPDIATNTRTGIYIFYNEHGRRD